MDHYQDRPELTGLTLGQPTDYSVEYAPELLQAIPRALNRQSLSVVEEQPFDGVDVWHAYELSWLNPRSKPVVALGRFTFRASSSNIIESKSFKLYLNSLNQTSFESEAAVLDVLMRDLSACCGAELEIELFSPSDNTPFSVTSLPGVCIDGLDVDANGLELSAHLLNVTQDTVVVEEVLHSHLLKSNCLITNQPDWASLVIDYAGPRIEHESLLRYLISFRMHNEFHEQCVERIFMDLYRVCKPTRLSVQALYTRRGGLDINPFRSTEAASAAPQRRINRQ